MVRGRGHRQKCGAAWKKVDPDYQIGDVLRVRTNGLHGGVRLLKKAPSSQEWRDLLADLEPDVIYGE